MENWFEESNGLFQHIYWPPQFPDSKLIKNLWDELERKFQCSSPLSRTLPDLEEKLLHLWPKIDHHSLKKVVDSMPSRMKAVIKAKDGPINLINFDIRDFYFGLIVYLITILKAAILIHCITKNHKSWIFYFDLNKLQYIDLIERPYATLIAFFE